MQITDTQTFKKSLDSKGRVTVPKDIRDEWGVADGDTVELAVVGADDGGHICDECGDSYSLPEIAIFNRGSDDEEKLCTGCLSPEDRVI